MWQRQSSRPSIFVLASMVQIIARGKEPCNQTGRRRSRSVYCIDGHPMSVEISRQGRVLVVSMAREEKRNALNAAITAGIDSAMNQLEDDPDLWCGILTGGEQVFSAGADLASGPGEPTERGGLVGLINR